jgi:putative ABC transport system permease protein
MFGYSFELAVRGLHRFPKSTALAVVTVAIGLAASMTTLVLLHMLSADPLPGRSQHLYVAWVDTVQAKSGDYSSLDDVTNLNYRRIKMPDVQTLMGDHKSLQQAAVANVYLHIDSPNGQTIDDQEALLTTSDFIPMFGVPLREGRTWTADEDAAHALVAVIDSELAQKMFGTTHAVGRTLNVKNHAFRIIGISAHYAPQPHFYGLQAWTFSGSDYETVFVPYTSALDAGVAAPSADACDAVTEKDKSLFDVDPKHCAWLGYWVELDTSQQVDDFKRYLDNYAHQQTALLAFGKKPQSRLLNVQQWLTLQNVIPDNVRLNVWLAGSFLLLCMVNVAGLLAAKFMRRSAEVGVRRALGASRRAVMLQHLIEAGTVCVLGGVLAWPLTLLGLSLLRMQDQGFTDLAHLDATMFGALFALALLVGILVGWLPAWRVSLVQPGLQIKSA